MGSGLRRLKKTLKDFPNVQNFLSVMDLSDIQNAGILSDTMGLCVLRLLL